MKRIRDREHAENVRITRAYKQKRREEAKKRAIKAAKMRMKAG